MTLTSMGLRDRNHHENRYPAIRRGIRVGVFAVGCYYASTVVSVPLALLSKGFSKIDVASFFAIGAVCGGAVLIGSAPIQRRLAYPSWILSLVGLISLAGLTGISLSGARSLIWLFGALLAPMVLVYPLLIHIATEDGHRRSSELVSSLRGTFVVGYVSGLCAVAVIQQAHRWGMPVNPLLLSGVLALTVVVASRGIRPVDPWNEADSDASVGSTIPRRYVGLAVAAVLALVAADTLRLVYLPLYVVHRGLPAAWISILMLACVIAELPALPVLGRLTDRYGAEVTLLLVCALGLLSFVMVDLSSHSLLLLLLSQAVYATFTAGVQSVAMVHLGGVLRGGLGAGAGVFTVVTQVGAVAGVASPLLIPDYGGQIFLIAGMFCALAAVFVFVGWPQTKKLLSPPLEWFEDESLVRDESRV